VTPPLLLLPLRLEYRVIADSLPRRVVVGDAVPTDRDALRCARRELLVRPFTVNDVPVDAGSQIWFRWFFDDGFAERGVQPITDNERRAVAAFEAAVGGRRWWRADDAVVAGAWSLLAAHVGPARALHLLRSRGAPAETDWEQRVGRITLLPARVGLFALDDGGLVTPLGEGAPVPADLRYTPDALAPGGWLVDFDAALAAGMGLRLTDPQLVTAALDADWLVAIGLHTENAKSGMARLLRDAVANGTFGFLDQDTPTNNSSQDRPPAIDGRRDPVAFLRAATEDEAGLLASPLEQAADLLAEALAVNAQPLRQAPGAADTGLEDARAMIRAVGPALLDAVTGAVRQLNAVTDEDVVEFLARDVVARGVLPVVRFGNNPYGVLPLTDVGALEPLGEADSAERAISGVLSIYAAEYLRSEAAHAAEAVIRIEPNESRLADKLEAILRQLPTSRRLLVADLGQRETAPLGCSYVVGPGYKAEEYLSTLRTEPLSELVDPTEADPRPPLLYRLARISIVKGTSLSIEEFLTGRARLTLRERMNLPRPSDGRLDAFELNNLIRLARRQQWPLGLPSKLRDAVGTRAATTVAALEHLEQVARRPDGQARLEVLLMETIDVVAHRADAWMSGLAHRHLIGRRRAGEDGLRGGWYGFLSKPQADAATGSASGHLQAPSMAQAVSAALLRAAHQRFPSNGAFAIDLSSRRVRQALRLLALLQRGMSPARAVGLRAERRLHERKRADLVLALRDNLPIRDPDAAARLELRALDGLDLIDSSLAFVPRAADRALLADLQHELRDDLDALADLIMCEATHLRASRQPVAANAWLAVLSGEPVPREPTFIRTIRSGHASSHRIIVAFEPVGVADVGSPSPPRVLAEPALAAAAAKLLPQAANAVLDLVIAAADGAAPQRIRFRLGADLGLAPLDLAIGGESELAVRARHTLVRRWREDPAIAARLGPLPTSGLGTFLARTRPLSLDLGVGPGPVRTLLDRAAELRRLLGEGRPLEATDLAAAASPAPLEPSSQLQALRPARAELRRRANRLRAAATTAAGALRAAVSTALIRARNHQRLVEAHADEAALAASLAELEAARSQLDAALVTASRFAEPGALRLFGTLELAAAAETFEAEYDRLGARLEGRAAALAATLADTEGEPATGSEAALQVARLAEALSGALDGRVLTILPPIARVPATTPLLRAAAGLGAVLGDWGAVRQAVGRARRTATQLGGYRAFRYSPAATDDETGDPTADSRDETIAPRTRLFGAIIARSSLVNEPELYVGTVADEWAEIRPSRRQQTGLAINYDAPQSEPPHCLLLCEPPAEASPEWTPEAAAEMAGHAIRWMMIRALPAQERRLPGPLLPFANQVTAKPTAAGLRRRIPIRHFRRPLDLLSSFADGALVVFDDDDPVGRSGIGLREITGYVAEED
jgi:hypothetical protein